MTAWIMTRPDRLDDADRASLDAATNGLSLPWSSGAVEGRVNHF